MPSGVKIRDLNVGDGVVAEHSSVVVVHLRGSLHRGDECCNTYLSGVPMRICLSKRDQVAGLRKGIEGMRVGGRRELIVSPHLAYTVTGFGRAFDNLRGGQVPARSSRVAVCPKPTTSRRSGAAAADERPTRAGGPERRWRKRTAGFPTCCTADFPIGRPFRSRARAVNERSAGWETRDTADWEVCGTRDCRF